MKWEEGLLERRSMFLTENQLDAWVRGNSREAQGVIVELVWRLVAASSSRPKERRFPLGDSIGQPGPDGILNVDFPFEPFVPEGVSFWEIGTDEKAGDKATDDYKGLIEALPPETRSQAAFVFVTPRSGTRSWPHTWKEKAQAKWLEDRRARNEWRDVRVIDGTKLIDWVHHFPSVELWLAQKMRLPVQQIETPDQRWGVLRTIGHPPQLLPHVFLMNRDAACAKLKEIFEGNAVQLKLDTHFPDQVVDFVCAYLADMDDETRIDATGRCLIVSGVDAWNAIIAQHERHILVADPTLDLSGAAGTKLLEKARRSGHAVIFWDTPGGVPHPNCEIIPQPKTYQLKEALERVGYAEERARILAQKSGGNLGVLLRCLQNLSLMPEWADDTAAADLVIAEFLGAWNEESEGDCSVIGALAGKSYGEWIAAMREVVVRPGTPLLQRERVWRFSVRYEGWYALGRRVFDEHLDRFQKAVLLVLREKDPKFELPKEERYAASIHGKVPSHSHHLRKGIAETLALLGSHDKALTSCSSGKAAMTAALAVRDVLSDADGVLWASLNDLLPLLAEAAPGEFLDAVESAMGKDRCPFDEMFAEEGDGIMGTTYTSGLLWALETLAWDPEYLTRVVVLLGELSARDPGGRWANRPSNSLTTILLPWLPETCASVPQRLAAVAAILDESPEVGWKLLLSLLPTAHSSSCGSRRPAWRETIPENWEKGVSQEEYWAQVRVYSDLAVRAAKGKVDKLVQVIHRLEDLPHSTHESLLSYIQEYGETMPEVDKQALWTELVDVVSKHRKYAGAQWAMAPERVEAIARLAGLLAPGTPQFRYQRLFSERDLDLYEEKGNYDSQRKQLDVRRQKAVQEILTSSGTQAVFDFATSVQSPWRVGVAFGFIAGSDVDRLVLPTFLSVERNPLALFAGGYEWGRFRSRGWIWVDEINTSGWKAEEIGIFLAYLPFHEETWKRAASLLGSEQSFYWLNTNANAYEAEVGIEFAVDQLISHGRPYAAIRCLSKMKYGNQRFDPGMAVRALMAAIDSPEGVHNTDSYEIVQIIKALQNDPATSEDDLFRVEWAYLRLLDGDDEVWPKLLNRRLSREPKFFCEVIRLVYRSRTADHLVEETTESAKAIATNAYHLLQSWQNPPGTFDGGTYDNAALANWLEGVKKECSETGHLEAAMAIVGHVLFYAPPDPDGLWINRAVATVLNAKDTAEMREGFTSEIFNSRGVHTFTAGRAEREIAATNRIKADAVDAAGFHRLATALRELAASYERDAERESRRDPFSD